MLRAEKIIRALQKASFLTIRQTGSHIRLRHSVDHSRNVTIPMHSKDISRKVLASILRQAKMSVPEFLHFLNQ